MTGVSYATSAEMAKELGPFSGYQRNRDHMLRVIRNHRAAAHATGVYENLNVPAVALDHANCPDQTLVSLAKSAWDEALRLGEQHGYRNAQTTVIAPTGTIGLVMDCDTTGIEPDFALVKFKKLAGGGYFKIINQSVPAALEKLGYSTAQIRRDRGPCRRPRLAWPGARHQPHLADRPRLRPPRDREGRGRTAIRLRHQVRLQPVDARRRFLQGHPRHPRGQS